MIGAEDQSGTSAGCSVLFYRTLDPALLSRPVLPPCLSPPFVPPILPAMLGHQLVIVSDAHPRRAVEAALLAFLERVPDLGDALLVNGDLFDFWFEYRRVIPRTGFRVAAALAALRKRVPIVMIGGNHDRWGGDFWREDLEIG